MAELQPQNSTNEGPRIPDDVGQQESAMIASRLEQLTPDLSASASTRLAILVVDSEASVFDVLSRSFSEDYDVVHAREGLAALTLAVSRPPSLILLDVKLPDIDGYQICDNLKHMQETRHIPIILLTRAADTEAETRAMGRWESSDFLSKPVNSAALRARVANQMNLRRAQDQLLHAAYAKVSGRHRRGN